MSSPLAGVQAKEGQIAEESAAWQDMSKRDREKRKRADAEKATKLRSPNFFVSPTRLCLRNLPYSMDEKALKQLLLAAVCSPHFCLLECRAVFTRQAAELCPPCR